MERKGVKEEGRKKEGRKERRKEEREGGSDRGREEVTGRERDPPAAAVRGHSSWASS